MKMVTVGDLGKIITGKTPPTKDKDNYGGDIPFITPVDMVGNRNIFNTERYISKKGLNTVKNCFLPEHSVCVSCIGSDMGKTVITVKPSVTNQQINSIIVDENSYDYLYVYYLMRTLEEKIKSLGKNATAVPILNKTKFSNIEVSIFDDLERQKAISSILSAYDNLIENNQKQIKLLEEAAQRLYKEWFVDLRFPGYETTPIVDGIPEGWERCPFSKKVSVMSGGTPKTDVKEYYGGDIPFYSPKDHFGCFFAYTTAITITEEGLKNCNSALYPVNTIIITARGTVGKTVLLATPMAMNQSCYALKCDELRSPYYLFFSLNAEVAKLKGMSNGGVFDTIIVKTFDNIFLTVPDSRLVKLFEEKVTPIMCQIKKKMEEIMALSEARDRLLPKLMSGEIEV